MTKIEKNFKEIQKVYENAKETLQRDVQNLVKLEINKIFKDFNDIESLSFIAYTPYFNDGDVCRYSVYSDEDSIYVNNQSIWDNDDDEDRTDEENQAATRLSILLANIPAEIIENAFGEGKFTFHKNGDFIIDEYEHD